MAAALENRTEVAFYLLDSGANINALTNLKSNDSKLQTVVHYTCKRGSVSLLKRLIRQGADYEARDSLGSTPFSLACGYGNVPVVKFMLENGYAKTNVKTLEGTSPLMLASHWGHTEVVRLLLKQGTRGLNLKNNYGNTPLHFAAYSGREENVIILLSYNADRTIKNNEGKTAEDMARENGHLTIANKIRFSK